MVAYLSLLMKPVKFFIEKKDMDVGLLCLHLQFRSRIIQKKTADVGH